MCGIVGFWQKDGKAVEENILRNMVHRLVHRGPDDHGIWTRGPVGLGHTRLSILDLSKNAHQPFVTNDKKGVLSYCGEIYNYLDLRQKLQKQEGIPFKSTSDTEVLLYALHLWGVEKTVPLLEGMFAFAYFDLRDHTLWLARDRSGIKPLYWVEKENVNIFASEIKALFDHPDIVCRPDMHALTTHILFMRLDGDWTPFENVKRVLPGTIIKINQNRTEVITYFDLLRDVRVDRIIGAERSSIEDSLRSFEEKIIHGVKSHLVSDAPLATMCSGGVDSSLITAVAKGLKPDLEAYVADVEGFRIAEAERAQKVCDHVGVPLHKVKVDQDSYLRHWPEAVYHNDQPNHFPQDVISMMVSKAAYNDGFKVLLTGEGADELFGGYPWQAEAYHMWRLRRWHSMVIPHNRLFKKLGHYISRLAPFDLENLMKHPFSHLGEMSFHQTTPGLLSPIDGLQRRVRAEKLFKKLEQIPLLEERAFLARSFEDFYTHLRTSLSSNEKMGLSVSVEQRVPFLSNQLIDFGLHLHCRAKYHKKISKYIVKTFAAKKLPHEIIHAEKVGFGFSDRVWIKGVDFLRGGMVTDLFKWGDQELEAIYEDLKIHPRQLFILISVELWARIYLNHETPEALSEKLLSCLK